MGKRMLGRGISVVIAELTIVALAIAVSIAVIGYIQGWFGFSSSQSEGLHVYPDSRLVINYSSGRVYVDLHVYAKYKPYLKIVGVILDNRSDTGFEVLAVEQGGPIQFDNGDPVLPVGTKAWIRVHLSGAAAPIPPDYGSKVEVVIITDIGYAYRIPVKIEVVR